MPWVMAAVAAGTAIMGAVSSAQAGAASAEAMKRNAALYDEQMLEQLRRTRREHTLRLGNLQAVGHARGVQYSGSTKAFVDDQAREMKRERYWMNQHRLAARSAAKKGAAVQHNASMWQTGTQLLRGGMQAYQMYNATSAPSTAAYTGWGGVGGGGGGFGGGSFGGGGAGQYGMVGQDYFTLGGSS